jgi:NAD(P)H-dependent FMN reductase
MTLPLLQVIIASTRPTRIGGAVGDWFTPIAKAHGGFTVESVDLRDIALPLLDEPHHPMQQKYEHEHTKRWSATIARGDAYVFVTPEYDFSPPAALLNAIQCLAKEWMYKPVGLLSYGGVSAGLRSANQLRIICTANSMMPLPGAVSIPFAGKLVNADTGRFEPDEVQDKAARAMLDELVRWEGAMRVLRTS